MSTITKCDFCDVTIPAGEHFQCMPINWEELTIIDTTVGPLTVAVSLNQVALRPLDICPACDIKLKKQTTEALVDLAKKSGWY